MHLLNLKTMKMKKLFLFNLLVATCLLGSVDTTWAQPFKRNKLPVVPGDPQDTTTNVPIDGGLTILLAAGVGYGVKRIRGERKRKAVE